MPMRALLASAVSVCLLTNCTPYQEIDRSEGGADIAAPVGSTPAEPATEEALQTGAAEGGAGQIDTSVAAVHKIRNKSDIAGTADAMLKLADKDSDGMLTRDEFDLLAPALAQADNSVNPSVEGGPVANPGAGEVTGETTAEPIRAEEFFSETASADNTISRNELATALTSRFDAADADANGELSPEESSRFAASMLFARE
jgi:hypothetical protein